MYMVQMYIRYMHMYTHLWVHKCLNQGGKKKKKSLHLEIVCVQSGVHVYVYVIMHMHACVCACMWVGCQQTCTYHFDVYKLYIGLVDLHMQFTIHWRIAFF